MENGKGILAYVIEMQASRRPIFRTLLKPRKKVLLTKLVGSGMIILIHVESRVEQEDRQARSILADLRDGREDWI